MNSQLVKKGSTGYYGTNDYIYISGITSKYTLVLHRDNPGEIVISISDSASDTATKREGAIPIKRIINDLSTSIALSLEIKGVTAIYVDSSSAIKSYTITDQDA